jgi:RND family efflux transporter MFP subunit
MSATSPNVRILIRLLAGLVVVAAGVFALIVSLRPVATVEPAGPAEALDAKPGSVTVVEEYSQELKSEIGGRVLRADFNLDPGKVVKSGEVLAQLDPADLLLAINQERITLTALKATFAADHTRELDLEVARAELANARRLNKLGAVSDNDLAARERAVKIAAQALELERIDHKRQIDTKLNDIQIDERKLAKMTIRSPLDGTVSQVFAHPGDLITLEAPVATLITTNKVVVGKISEEDFAQVSVGEEARVTFLPYGDTEFGGRIAKILPTADPETQRHIVHIDVRMDAAHPLVPGINGEVIIVVGRHPARVVVPRRAVFELDGKSVFVVRDGVVTVRKVIVGYLWSRGAEIVAGLEPGEKVIVDELDAFHAGDRVRVAEAPSEVASR